MVWLECVSECGHWPDRVWLDIDWELWSRLGGKCVCGEWLGNAELVSLAFGLQKGRFSAGITTGLQGKSVWLRVGSVCLHCIAADPWLVENLWRDRI